MHNKIIQLSPSHYSFCSPYSFLPLFVFLLLFFCSSLSPIVFIISVLIIGTLYCCNYTLLLLHLFMTHLVMDFIFFKNDKLKYTEISQRRTFNSFSLFYIFFAHRFLCYYIFLKLSCTSITSLIYAVYFEFFRCNALHSLGNMCSSAFLKRQFFIAISRKLYLLQCS